MKNRYKVIRVLDVMVSGIAVVILWPLLVLIAVLIKTFSPGKIIFKQKRLGLNGKEFNIYKFRTMVENAPEILKSNHNLYKEYINNGYTLPLGKDPRITKLGMLLRKTKLDELPQLFNVAKGEMSLVGPRPIVPEELTHYQEERDVFLSVKPGLTGYWQSFGGSIINYPERAQMELYYIAHQSFWFDLKIIIKTITSIISSKGAY